MRGRSAVLSCEIEVGDLVDLKCGTIGRVTDIRRSAAGIRYQVDGKWKKTKKGGGEYEFHSLNTFYCPPEEEIYERADCVRTARFESEPLGCAAVGPKRCEFPAISDSDLVEARRLRSERLSRLRATSA